VRLACTLPKAGPQNLFLNLSGRGSRELVDHVPLDGPLLLGEFGRLQMRKDRLRAGPSSTGPQSQESGHHFALPRVRRSDDSDIGDIRMAGDRGLDILAGELLTTSVDDVLEPSLEREPPLLVELP
jgi:hypothetical protein